MKEDARGSNNASWRSAHSIELLLVGANGGLQSLVARAVALEDGWYLSAVCEADALGMFALAAPDVTVIEGAHGTSASMGFDLCRRIRCQSSQAGLIMAIQADAPKEVMSAFDAGADDCITMLCDVREFHARVKSLARRLQNSELAEIPTSLAFADDAVCARDDDLDRRLNILSRRYHLSQRERSILGEVVRGVHLKEIACKVGCEYSTVRTHVRRLSRKLRCTGVREVLLRFFLGTDQLDSL
jgi:DNA-binding NarL/FixJ family response regulator